MQDGLTGFIVAIARVAINDGDEPLLAKVIACAAVQEIESVSMLDTADLRRIVAAALNAKSRDGIRLQPFFDLEPEMLATIVTDLRDVERAEDFVVVREDGIAIRRNGREVPSLLSRNGSLVLLVPQGDGRYRVEPVTNLLQLRGLGPSVSLRPEEEFGMVQ